MADPAVLEKNITFVGPGSAGIKQGDLVYNDGTRWAKADADAASSAAQAIATQSCLTDDDDMEMAKEVTLYDSDAPYTVGNTQYLSTTAGAHTATMPTGNADLVQSVGMAVKTTIALLRVANKHVHMAFIAQNLVGTTGEDNMAGTGTTGTGASDAGWAGKQIDAAGETTFIGPWVVPHTAIALKKMKVGFNSINASAFDNDVTVAGAYDGASNAQDTGASIIAGDWEQADADNIIFTQDVSAAPDADFFQPGRWMCMLLDPDGITNDVTLLGAYVLYECVCGN